MRAWTVREASELYGIPYWGGEYFSVSATGDVLVHPNGPGSANVNLPALVEAFLGALNQFSLLIQALLTGTTLST
mgnify:CR=1 FL=1